MAAVEPRPDPRSWTSDRIVGATPDEVRAELDALVARARDEAALRRGRPLLDENLGLEKGRLPTVTTASSRGGRHEV